MLEINLPHMTCGTFALQNIHFSLRPGEACAILGLNGAGKSTLLKSLTGIYSSASRSFLWNNKPLTTSLVEYIPPFIQPQLKIQTRYFLEASLLKLRITEEDHIRLTNISRFLKITNLLEKDLQVLSSGEMSKVLLAKALLSRKPIILMDEPTSFLDFQYKSFLRKLLLKIKSKRLFLIATHDFLWVRNLSDHYLGLHEGRQIFFTPELCRKNLNQLLKNQRT